MRTIALAAAALAIGLSSTTLTAQERVTLDLRAAYAFPITDVGDAELSSGPGFGATIAYRLQPHLHLYGGWDWLHFGSEVDLDFEETGYAFGLRFEHPLNTASRTHYRLEVGGLYKHIEVENADGELVDDSGHGLGFEVGAGLLVPIGRQWSLAPTVRLRSHAPSFDVGGTTVDDPMRYIGLELGFSRRF